MKEEDGELSAWRTNSGGGGEGGGERWRMCLTPSTPSGIMLASSGLGRCLWPTLDYPVRSDHVLLQSCLGGLSTQTGGYRLGWGGRLHLGQKVERHANTEPIEECGGGGFIMTMQIWVLVYKKHATLPDWERLVSEAFTSLFHVPHLQALLHRRTH